MEDLITKGDSGIFPICNQCKNYIDDLKCKAFTLIPDEILVGDNDHSKPLPGQRNKITFEPNE